MNLSRNILFEPQAFEEFIGWATEDKKVFLRVAELVEEVSRNPFEGKGKPEPLKHNFKGYYSRRITDKHRMIYSVTDLAVTFIAFRNHYNDK